MSIVWSCGGGTQSAAIAVLIIQGKLPRPDLSVISDTGREASETWLFFDKFMYPQLKDAGVILHRIPHSFDGDGLNTVDLFSGKKKKTIVLPMYTLKQRGQVEGMLPKYCSNEWKSRPVRRFIRNQELTSGEIWIGFSSDEVNRMRGNDLRQKWTHTYPLIDLRMTRGDCVKLVEDMGWGIPPRSACWMCPYRNDQEWLMIKGTEDFDKAVALEKELQKSDPDVFFHNSCEPLTEVNFNENQTDLFGKPCTSGMCFT